MILSFIKEEITKNLQNKYGMNITLYIIAYMVYATYQIKQQYTICQ